jgi:hypothetical protein
MVNNIERFIFDSQSEWKKFRAEKALFTASRISEILANGRVLMNDSELIEYKKSNPKSQAKYKEDDSVLGEGVITYILELIQTLEGAAKEPFYDMAMQWGNDTEPQAVINYCEKFGYDIEADDVIYTSEGGIVFFVGDNILGCTPDLILKDRVVQFKCPESSTHLYYRLFVNDDNFKSELPEYYAQVQLEMMLAKKDQCDFVSFDPRYKRKSLQMHVIDVKADIDFQEKIHRKALLCEAKKQEFLNQINKL